jgi:diguanylate cyclase (GGDEF)-like protein
VHAEAQPAEFLAAIVAQVSVGLFAVDPDMRVVLWNRFMETNSTVPAEAILGRCLFDVFPELPRRWLELKIQSVFTLKNFAFTRWDSRPYLFRFPHNRPITGGVDWMRQDCTLFPLKDTSGEVRQVCVTVVDATDTCIYHARMQQALTELGEASNRDPLTGIYNRGYLERVLAQEFSRERRYGGTLSLLLMDLDHFKRVNDTFGHLAGDEVLKNAARVFATGVRDCDTVGRYGGEEFAAILPATGIGGARTLAHRLCEAVRAQPLSTATGSTAITVSVGVAQLHERMHSHEDLIRAADRALYQSKRDGRDRVTCVADLEPLAIASVP